MKQKLKHILLIILLTMLANCSIEKSAPVADVIPDTTFTYDSVLVDNYSWMKDKTRSSTKLLSHLKAEQKYTDSVLASHQKLQKKLFTEMKSRLQIDDSSVPVKKDDYYYYNRVEENKQYSLYCRRKGTLQAPEEIYLNVNKLADGHEFYELNVIRISPDHRYVVYTSDTSGAEIFDMHILDLQNNTILPETRSNMGNIIWAKNNQTIFYTVADEAGRTFELYRHKLGSSMTDDELIFTERDERFWLGLGKSKNKQFIILSSNSKTTSETYILPAEEPDNNFVLIEPREAGIEYYPLFNDDQVYILTNWKTANRKIMQTSLNELSRKYWQEYIPGSDSVKIYADILENHLIISERCNAFKKMKIVNLSNSESHYVDFDESICSFSLWSSTDYHSPTLRYSYESLQTPYSTFEYNMNTRERKLLKQEEVKGDFAKENYNSERLYAVAADGTKVPISILYRKDKFQKDGSNPLYLNAYGAYGDSFDPYFSTSRLSLLDRGVVYAIAHVRGGGDMGEYWYEQGKMLNKKNTFTDFIDCSKYLITNKYTSSEGLIINGGSAGGLLIGAVLNMQPELFKVAIADVPFVDILNTMLDPTLSAVVSEYEEWGNPNNLEEFEYILSYSPYDNITSQNYPHILAVAGFLDSRVNYWEAAKWTAKLRALKTDDNYNLLLLNMNAGHGGSSGRYDYLEELATIYAFIFKALEE